MQKSNSSLQKIQDLLKRLELVQTFADRGFWLQSQELGQLLDLDSNTIDTLNTKTIGYEFTWRNFLCSAVGQQAEEKLWRIAYNHRISAPNSDSISITPAQIKENHYPQPENPQIVPAIFARIDNFLPRDLLQKLIKYVLDNQARFEPSRNSGDDTSYRKSWVLYQFPEYSEIVLKYVRSLIPQVLRSLKMSSFEIGDIESQLTAHNDGNYYKVHNDNGSPDSCTRELTYVYYFYQEPKQFTGGELVIYDGLIKNNMFDKADTYKIYTPSNNTIIFFPSHYLHEVLPVSCPSRKFEHSRFTINGWVRRKG